MGTLFWAALFLLLSEHTWFVSLMLREAGQCAGRLRLVRLVLQRCVATFDLLLLMLNVLICLLQLVFKRLEL